MLVEFLYRALTAGFYGAITQAFRKAEPAWAAGFAVLGLLPIISHSIELTVHLLRGTPKIITSLTASICFTVVSTLFNLYAMRRGALVVGAEGRSLTADLKTMPRLICGFLAAGPARLDKLIYNVAAQAGVRPIAGRFRDAGRAGWRAGSTRRNRRSVRRCGANSGTGQSPALEFAFDAAYPHRAPEPQYSVRMPACPRTLSR